MRNTGRFMAVTSAVILALAPFGKAEEVKKDNFVQGGNLDTTFKGRYVGNKLGTTFTDNEVLQNVVGLRTKAGNVFYWDNFDLKKRELTEIDVGYSTPSLMNRWVGANLSFEGYTYPNAKKMIWDLEPGMNVFSRNLPVDIKLYGAASLPETAERGGIARLSVGKTFPLDKLHFPKGSTIGLEGNLVYNEKYYSDKKGLSHFSVNGNLSIPVTKRFSVNGGVLFNEPIGKFNEGNFRRQLVPYVGGRVSF